MSNEADHFYSQQDTKTKILLAEHKGDELTDILVAALYEAFRILDEEAASETVH